MNKIHPQAIVHPGAKLGDNVEVGPFAYIDDNVVIGDNCKIYPNAIIYEYSTIGNNCQIHPGAIIGGIPQDLKFDGEVSYVQIGNNTTVREYATINRGTRASGKGVTKVGDNTLIMSYAHIAHDCCVGNHCIVVSYVGLAGETDMEDWAIVGGGTLVHQFTHIGRHAMVGGGSAVNKDIPPYSICGRVPICFAGINLVGLRRRGFDSDVIFNIKEIYNTIYYEGLNVSDACAEVEARFPASEERDNILNFIRGSKRGIVRAGDPNIKGVE